MGKWVVVVETQKGKFGEHKKRGEKNREPSGVPIVERLENFILRN